MDRRPNSTLKLPNENLTVEQALVVRWLTRYPQTEIAACELLVIHGLVPR